MKSAGFALFLTGVVILSFSAGALMTAFKAFPYRQVNHVRLAAMALRESAVKGGMKGRSSIWYKARNGQRGLTRFDSALAFPGYTLFTSAHGQQAFLLSMDGEVVHQWRLDYDKIWEASEEIRRPPDYRQVFFRKAALLPGGELLALYEESGATPWGLGMVKMDRSSKIIWKYLKRAHHDFHVCQDGRVFTLIHRIQKKPLKGISQVRAPYLEDLVAVLSPEGRELEQISVYSALAGSAYKPLLKSAYPSEKGDYIHANAIKVLTPELASSFHFAKPGQMLVSMRNINFIGLMDPGKKKFTWGARGSWIWQHDPDFLPDGDILLFDNLGRLGEPGGRSRVIEFNPLTSEITWQFHGSKENRFYSKIRSSQQRLPNGNTLITESEAGRILEVTRDGRVAWEYFNPAVKEGDSSMIPAVCWATRLAAHELGPGFSVFLHDRQNL